MNTYCLFVSATLFFFVSSAAFAQSTPQLTSYQGRLTDASGNAVTDGTGYEIEIRLWPASTGGTTPLWSARYTGVSVKSGALNIMLGSPSGTPIAGATTTDLKTAFASPTIFLGMTVTKSATGTPVANPAEILPRQQWMSVPFAFQAEAVGPNGVTTSAIVDGTIQKADLSTTLQTELNQLTPSGTVVAFAGSTAPPGWLKCDGTTIDRTQYSTLFGAIGTAHGSGNGSTTFHLPDYRGRFLRGVNGDASDSGVARDPDAVARGSMASGGAVGNNVGSVQTDELKAHTHDVLFSNPPNGSLLGSGNAPSRVNRADSTNTGRTPTEPTGGNETRPRNAYVNFIIKI